MNNYLHQLDAQSLRILRRVGAQAQKAGLRAYVVGGCVRDLILKRKVLDLDVVIEGDAVLAARTFSSTCRGQLTAYPQFGTATVLLPNGRVIDFVSARQESYPYPGALPAVIKGDLGQDLFRRDFTINAMAVAINPKHFGHLIDRYGGLDDIKNKRIRILHDQSFVDDPTRILRAARFEQRFQFRIEPLTLRLLGASLKKKAPATVKPQRYFEEFKKNLKELKASKDLQRLSQLGALEFLGHSVKLKRHHILLLQEVPKTLLWADQHLTDGSAQNGWLLYLMIVFDGVPTARVAKALERFGVTNVDRKKVIGSLSSEKILLRLVLSTRKAFEAMRPLSVEELLFLRAKTSNVTARARIQKYLVQWRHLTLKINGDDLKDLGIPSGKVFKTILDEILCARVEGQCPSRSDQLAYARDLVQQHRR